MLAGLVLAFPAAARGESDAGAQDSGSSPDGGVVADAAKVASNVDLLVKTPVFRKPVRWCSRGILGSPAWIECDRPDGVALFSASAHS